MNLSALAARAGMTPGRAHKYLASLIRSGMVAQGEAGGPYDLGPFAVEIGLAALRRVDVYDMAAPVLDDLRDLLGLTASLAIWANRGPTIVRWAETPDVMSATVRVGTVVPVLTSAIGRIFAAFLDRRMTLEIIEAELADPNGLARRSGLKSMADVEKLLREFRARRMAVAENLVDPGRAVLTAPVFNHEDGMVAALTIVGGAGRLDTSWTGTPARELAAAAAKLSRRLGARVEEP